MTSRLVMISRTPLLLVAVLLALQLVVPSACLLYTSDAADERSSVDLGGRRILKKKKADDVRERQPRERRNI